MQGEWPFVSLNQSTARHLAPATPLSFYNKESTVEGGRLPDSEVYKPRLGMRTSVLVKKN